MGNRNRRVFRYRVWTCRTFGRSRFECCYQRKECKKFEKWLLFCLQKMSIKLKIWVAKAPVFYKFYIKMQLNLCSSIWHLNPKATQRILPIKNDHKNPFLPNFSFNFFTFLHFNHFPCYFLVPIHSGIQRNSQFWFTPAVPCFSSQKWLKLASELFSAQKVDAVFLSFFSLFPTVVD